MKRVVLRQGAIDGAHEFLEVANINPRTVFPDMQGVANYVRQIVGI